MSASPALALVGTFFFAAGNIVSKKAVQHVSPIGGILLALPVALAVSATGTLVVGTPPLSWTAVGIFALVGLLTPGIARLTNFTGVQRLDTSVAVPVQSSLHPVTGVVVSYVALQEQLSALRLAGIVGILGGVWLVTSQQSGDPVKAVAYQAERPPRLIGRRALVFPVVTGICFGLADVLRRIGMQEMAAAAFGTMVSMASGLAAWLLLVGVSRSLRARVHFGRGGRRWFLLQGAFNASAILCVFAALAEGDVSVVSPLVASQPLLVMLLAHLALRDLERITPLKVVGGALVVAGAAAIVSTA